MLAHTHLDDTFFRVFTAWFHSDLLPDSDAEIVKLAGVCASDLHNKRCDLAGIKNDLEAMIANWNTRDAVPFIKATTTDWLADNETEELLRKILRQLIADLGYFLEQDRVAKGTTH